MAVADITVELLLWNEVKEALTSAAPDNDRRTCATLISGPGCFYSSASEQHKGPSVGRSFFFFCRGLKDSGPGRTHAQAALDQLQFDGKARLGGPILRLERILYGGIFTLFNSRRAWNSVGRITRLLPQKSRTRLREMRKA